MPLEQVQRNCHRNASRLPGLDVLLQCDSVGSSSKSRTNMRAWSVEMSCCPRRIDLPTAWSVPAWVQSTRLRDSPTRPRAKVDADLPDEPVNNDHAMYVIFIYFKIKHSLRTSRNLTNPRWCHLARGGINLARLYSIAVCQRLYIFCV